jgi:hypothetical protein
VLLQVAPVAHAVSGGNWQTRAVPVPLETHRSPGVVQSRDSMHWAWHLANAQTSGELQSLLIEQVAERAAPEELLQLKITTAAPSTQPHASGAIKDRSFIVCPSERSDFCRTAAPASMETSGECRVSTIRTGREDRPAIMENPNSGIC